MKQINTKQLWKHNILWMSLLLFSWQFRAFNTLWWRPSGYNYVSFTHIIMYNYVGLESYKQKNSSYHGIIAHKWGQLTYTSHTFTGCLLFTTFQWMNEPASCFARSVALSTGDKCTVIFYFSWILSLSLTLLHWNSICSDSCVRKYKLGIWNLIFQELTIDLIKQGMSRDADDWKRK